jgi:hypothetical protein
LSPRQSDEAEEFAIPLKPKSHFAKARRSHHVRIETNDRHRKYRSPGRDRRTSYMLTKAGAPAAAEPPDATAPLVEFTPDGKLKQPVGYRSNWVGV